MKEENEGIEGERDPVHERLVAHLLGELSAEETAAVEAELAGDAELRAKAATIEATIGLVRGLGAEAPELSATAREPLTAAESGPAAVVAAPAVGKVIQGPWHRRASVRAAAGILIIVSAAVAYQAMQPRMPALEGGVMDSLEVASAKDALHRGRTEGSAAVGGVDPDSALARASSPPELESSRGSDPNASRFGLWKKSEPALGSDPLNAVTMVEAGTIELRAALAPGAPADTAPSEYRGPGDSQPPGAVFAQALEALGYLGDSVATAEPTVAPSAKERQRLRSLGYLSADGGGLARPSSPGSDPQNLDGLRAVGFVDEEQEADFRLSFDADPVTGEDGFFLGGGGGGVFELERAALSPAERQAEQAILDRLGLEPERLGEALEALGYVSEDDDLQLDSPEGFELRRRVVRSQVVRERIEAQISGCRRAPGESLQDMIFRHWGTRPFTEAATDAQSTFAIDTDTASYTLARGMFERGLMPEAAQIRTEEFINYFDPEVPAPREETFAIYTELGASPFGRAQGQEQDTLLMRVVVRAKDVSLEERTPLALTFVVDVSGSMDTDNRIGLVKDSLKQLLTRLDGRDRVAIVAFSSDARIALPPTPANQRGRIEAAIEGLVTGGGTNADAGIVMGYGLAEQGFDVDLNNRVVFLSDGVANIGDTDQAVMIEKTAEARAKGIYLNTVGFGIGNHNDALLEQLADDGDGVCNYVDTPVEARKAFVENFTGAFETVARDAKIQVEFDPAKVGSYRLLGYENRAIADREFRNDSVDAGEVQAGRSAVALYELRDVDLSSGSLATVNVRYKLPFDAGRAVGEEAGALELSQLVGTEGTVFDFGAASTGFRKSALVAQVAEVLRRSLHARGDSMAELGVQVERLADQTGDPDFREFATLFASNREAIEALVKPATEGSGLLDELKYLQLELEREREAEGQPDTKVLSSLEQRITEAEERMRQLAFGARDR